MILIPTYYVLVSITWRKWTCYTSHYQNQVSAIETYTRDVFIFVQKDLYLSKTNISSNCKEKIRKTTLQDRRQN